MTLVAHSKAYLAEPSGRKGAVVRAKIHAYFSLLSPPSKVAYASHPILQWQVVHLLFLCLLAWVSFVT